MHVHFDAAELHNAGRLLCSLNSLISPKNRPACGQVKDIQFCLRVSNENGHPADGLMASVLARERRRPETAGGGLRASLKHMNTAAVVGCAAQL